MREKSEVGKIGEQIACEFLKEKKYHILYKNYLRPWGELDIIARDPDGVLVVVEVKTSWGVGEGYSPEQNYTFDKDRKTRKTTKMFMAKYPDLFDEDIGYRIDLITVQIKNPTLVDWHDDCDIRHYENL